MPTPGPVTEPRIDPTGHRVAYVTDGALHVVELDSDGDSRVARPPPPSTPTSPTASPEHVAAESMYRYRGFWWAPDGRQLLAARVDNEPVLQWWIADPANPQKAPRAIRYPAAGTANAEVTAHVLRLDGTRTELNWDRNAFEYLTAAELGRPRSAAVGAEPRPADGADPRRRPGHRRDDRAARGARPGLGASSPTARPLRTTAGRLVRASDRDGDRRLVIDGTPVTPDGLQVLEVNGADGETVYFIGIQEPTEEHLWRHHPEQGLHRLSITPGVHSGTANGGTVVRFERTEAGVAITATRADDTTATPINCLAAEPVLTAENHLAHGRAHGTCGRPCCCPPGTNRAQRSSRC